MIYGNVVRVAARFTILVYQAIFFSRSRADDGLYMAPGSSLEAKTEQLYYLWQFVCLSLVLLSVWVVDVVMQVRK